MLMENSSFIEIFELYFGGRYIYVLLVCLIAALIFLRKKTRISGAFLLFLIVTIICTCNPLAMMFWTKIIKRHIYRRMFWNLSLIVLFSFVVTELLCSKKKWVSVLCAAATVFCLCFFGKSMYFTGNFERTTNPFKIPQNAASIANYLVTEEEGKETRVLAPSGIFCYLRQYSSRIHQLYGRDIYGYTSPVESEEKHRLFACMEAENIDVPYVFPTARSFGCTYIILDMEKPLTADPLKYGYDIAADIGGCRIYKVKEE
ncbi:MAG: hypothetical protein IIY55_05460 [Blautia sp.]|nr:hypothetical protein [Blautia sp.]